MQRKCNSLQSKLSQFSLSPVIREGRFAEKREEKLKDLWLRIHHHHPLSFAAFIDVLGLDNLTMVHTFFGQSKSSNLFIAKADHSLATLSGLLISHEPWPSLPFCKFRVLKIKKKKRNKYFIFFWCLILWEMICLWECKCSLAICN